MRLTIVRATAVLLAALTAAACGSPRAARPVTTRATAPAAGQNGPAAFITRARQVTAQWERSAAARAWQTGLVLLDASDLTQIPRDQGFSSQQEKDAFGSGHFRLAPDRDTRCPDNHRDRTGRCRAAFTSEPALSHSFKPMPHQATVARPAMRRSRSL